MLQLSHLGPAVMILQVVDGQGDHFDPAFSELTTQSCGSAQLCGAHWGVVSGMGEQDSPSGMKSEICKAVSGVMWLVPFVKKRCNLSQFPFRHTFTPHMLTLWFVAQ